MRGQLAEAPGSGCLLSLFCSLSPVSPRACSRSAVPLGRETGAAWWQVWAAAARPYFTFTPAELPSAFGMRIFRHQSALFQEVSVPCFSPSGTLTGFAPMTPRGSGQCQCFLTRRGVSRQRLGAELGALFPQRTLSSSFRCNLLTEAWPWVILRQPLERSHFKNGYHCTPKTTAMQTQVCRKYSA